MQEGSILLGEEGITKKALSEFAKDWMLVSPLNSYTAALIPEVMVFGDVVFGGN